MFSFSRSDLVWSGLVRSGLFTYLLLDFFQPIFLAGPQLLELFGLGFDVREQLRLGLELDDAGLVGAIEVRQGLGFGQ